MEETQLVVKLCLEHKKNSRAFGVCQSLSKKVQHELTLGILADWTGRFWIIGVGFGRVFPFTFEWAPHL